MGAAQLAVATTAAREVSGRDLAATVIPVIWGESREVAKIWRLNLNLESGEEKGGFLLGGSRDSWSLVSLVFAARRAPHVSRLTLACQVHPLHRMHPGTF